MSTSRAISERCLRFYFMNLAYGPIGKAKLNATGVKG
jgi:hypothetical protein